MARMSWIAAALAMVGGLGIFGIKQLDNGPRPPKPPITRTVGNVIVSSVNQGGVSLVTKSGNDLVRTARNPSTPDVFYKIAGDSVFPVITSSSMRGPISHLETTIKSRLLSTARETAVRPESRMTLDLATGKLKFRGGVDVAGQRIVFSELNLLHLASAAAAATYWCKGNVDLDELNDCALSAARWAVEKTVLKVDEIPTELPKAADGSVDFGYHAGA